MLGKRLIASSIIIPVLIGLVWLDFYFAQATQVGHAGLILSPMALILLVLATGEMLSILSAGGLHPNKWSTFGGALLVFVFSCAPMLWKVGEYPPDCAFGKLGWPLIGIAGAVGLAFIAEIISYKEPGESVVKISANLMVVTYLGGLMAFLSALRFVSDNAWGMIAILSVVIICKFSDSTAYFLGKTFGKRKLFPILSPKKTYEGLAGALIGGVLASVFVFYVMVPWIFQIDSSAKILGVIIYGLVVAAAGTAGDLAESLIKRDMQKKDSSSWLPGLGGVLDIMDSILAASPAAFACWAAELVGPQAV